MNNCTCDTNPKICPEHTRWVTIPPEESCVTNPKEMRAMQDDKDPLEYLVLSVLAEDAKVHKHGADKYGKLNWRVSEIKASTYVGAILRHLVAFGEGNDIDDDSGLSHLAHIRACCAVVLDAQIHGTFVDDRGPGELISGTVSKSYKGESLE